MQTSAPLRIPADTPLGMGNCGIVAVAMLAGVTHADALEAVQQARKRGRGSDLKKDFGKGWSGWTTHEVRVFALDTLGFTLKSLLPRPMQLRTFALIAPEGQRVMVRISRHVVTLCGGLVFDQGHSHGIPVGEYSRARAIVTHAHIVTPKEV
jgi:hypothetical protein